MNILIFGHPGSGKTTHGKYIAEKYSLKYLSTGDMVRAISRNGSPLGKTVKQKMEQGQLIDDKLMWEIIKDHMEGKSDGFVFDGFPRTLPQMALLEGDGLKIDILMYIHLDHQISYQRLLKRGRTDDTPEKIQKRQEYYRELTKPLVDEFVKEGVPIVHIDNRYTIDEVRSEINDRLKEFE